MTPTATTATDPLNVLAGQLSVAADALRRLGVTRNDNAWESPERNSAGEVIGTSRRFDSGKKGFVEGGRRGLTYEIGDFGFDDQAGRDPADPVLVVEGLSDTAAGLGLGFDTVGRPSATGGGELLAELLRDRHVVVVMEHEDSGVGVTGAKALAKQLHPVAASVRIIEPPAGVKDLRSWINSPGFAGRAEVEAAIRGAAFFESQPRLNIINGDLVECRQVEWYLPDRIPIGICIILGMPDVGKTTLVASLAAYTTTGRAWGFCDGRAALGHVIWCAGESDLSMEVAPRLRANGADMSKIHFVRGAYRIGESDKPGKSAEVYEAGVDVSADISHLQKLARQTGAKKIVFDPLDAFIPPKVDISKGPAIRSMLDPLRKWCESDGITALVIHHPRKAQSEHAIDAVSGGRSFGALPRSVWVAGWVGKRRYFAPVKANLSPERPAALEFETYNEPAHSAPGIRWLGEAEGIDANAILAGREQTPALDDAAAFLDELIGDGWAWAKDVETEAEAARISMDAVRRAKKAAKYESKKFGAEKWFWRRQGSTAAPPEMPTKSSS